MREKWKSIDTSVESTIRTPITSFSKKNEFKILSVANIIIFSTLFGVLLTKEIGGLRENGLLKETSRWKSSDTRDKDGMNEKTIENTLISAFDCLDSSLPSARISLNPTKQCNIEDGSAYEKPERRRAQVLEHVRLVPVEITTCVVQFRVNVGWYGGEYAIESYMHADLETLRSTIIPTELDCHQAELDGTIKISTPEYGSIEALDLKLQLRGGKGTAMFQPIGFSRPDSWCKGTPFYPPKNTDEAIEYLDFSSNYERMKLWPTSKIRRAVVTYRLDATVQRSIGYISEEVCDKIFLN